MILGLVMLAAAAWKVLYQDEPAYEGKSLDRWLYGYFNEGDHVAMTNAVRQIGTNAIPTLLGMINRTRKPRSAAFGKVDAWWFSHVSASQSCQRWLPRWIVFPFWQSDHAKHSRDKAMLGFSILGAEAHSAVPALAEMYEKTTSPAIRDACCQALIAVDPTGQTAIPLFLQSARKADEDTRFIAGCGLSQLPCEPRLWVPILSSSLEATNPGYRGLALMHFTEIGPAAKGAVPQIVPLLKDPNGSVRLLARRALKAIDPETAVQEGVK